MSRIVNIFLLYKSFLTVNEKRHLTRAMNVQKNGDEYYFSSYNECRIFVKISHKLNYKKDYLYRLGKDKSDEYEEIKYTNECIGLMIKKYSLSE